MFHRMLPSSHLLHSTSSICFAQRTAVIKSNVVKPHEFQISTTSSLVPTSGAHLVTKTGFIVNYETLTEWILSTSSPDLLLPLNLQVISTAISSSLLSVVEIAKVACVWVDKKQLRHEKIMFQCAWAVLKYPMTSTNQAEVAAATALIASVMFRNGFLQDAQFVAVVLGRLIEMLPSMTEHDVCEGLDAILHLDRLYFNYEEALVHGCTNAKNSLEYKNVQIDGVWDESQKDRDEQPLHANLVDVLLDAVEDRWKKLFPTATMIDDGDVADSRFGGEDHRSKSFKSSNSEDHRSKSFKSSNNDPRVQDTSTFNTEKKRSPSEASSSRSIVRLLVSPYNRQEKKMNSSVFLVKLVQSFAKFGVRDPSLIEQVAKQCSNTFFTAKQVTTLLRHTAEIHCRIVDVLDHHDAVGANKDTMQLCLPLFIALSRKLEHLQWSQIARDDPLLILALRRMCEVNSLVVTEHVPILWEKIRCLRVPHRYVHMDGKRWSENDSAKMRQLKLGSSLSRIANEVKKQPHSVAPWRKLSNEPRRKHYQMYVPPAERVWFQKPVGRFSLGDKSKHSGQQVKFGVRKLPRLLSAMVQKHEPSNYW